MSQTAQARLLVLLAALLFSTGGAGIKASAFSGIQISALRSGVAALTLLVVLRGRISWSRPVLLAGAVYAATLTLFVLSTKLTTAANAIFLQAAAPLYLLVLAPLLLDERVSRRDAPYLLAMAAGMVGCIAGQPSATVTAPDPFLGNALGVLSGVSWACTMVALRYVERDRSRAGAGMSAVVIGNALAWAGAMPFAWPLPPAGQASWATVMYLGVCQIGLAYMCLTKGLRHVPALEASLLLLIEPVLNPLWTWLALGETPGAWTVAGGAVILAATAGRSLRQPRAPAPAP